jgi:hypothetical protein
MKVHKNNLNYCLIEKKARIYGRERGNCIYLGNNILTPIKVHYFLAKSKKSLSE